MQRNVIGTGATKMQFCRNIIWGTLWSLLTSSPDVLNKRFDNNRILFLPQVTNPRSRGMFLRKVMRSYLIKDSQNGIM